MHKNLSQNSLLDINNYVTKLKLINIVFRLLKHSLRLIKEVE